MKPLPRIRPGLLRHSLDEQVLVYDTGKEQVHLLDPTTAIVLELLQEGRWTPEGIIDELSRRTGSPAASDLLVLSVEELRRADLLLDEETAVNGLPDVSRRDLVRKLAAAGIAALMVPSIATLSANRAQAQTLGPEGSACTASGQCASNRCCGGLCRAAACSGGGAPCGTGVNPAQGETVPDCTCCSGTCTQTGASENSQNCT